ncbi:uncharacterized protein ACLA_098390 [Aspergillus clavatus NRRL 1]|uniref:BZIP domain-containing protein n=1 Tax=Aspergillus clavatus (strain ATCC 1007 / CBS 513.65 / DSM 816 / NCTC 3887 / NRRL 1 / QM 1276 / 107) TaxID=344612 RepID=A1CMW0_ASPCL|nr:uncharacterized protein ACLA_098390 [Aspergillus clavatus NRRL 1]EAW08897.1 hypothetical protein ACLA_098390 [Aspergillus clavatus NRRL 1]
MSLLFFPSCRSIMETNISPLNAISTPNEDWTCISDVEQRRRIQNRVAQRRHRRRIKELKKASSPSVHPLPTDQFTASRLSPSFPKAAPSPHPHPHSTPSADPSRPILHTPTVYPLPPLSPDVEMMLRQWYAQSLPPAHAGLGATPLGPMDGDALPMAQLSQMHLGPDLQKIYGLPHLADRAGDDLPLPGLSPRPSHARRRPELDRTHDSEDDSSSDSDDDDDNGGGGDDMMQGAQGSGLPAHSLQHRGPGHGHTLPPPISARDKAHIDRIRRAFRQGLRAGLASPEERASAYEDLQKRLVRAINKVIELYDYGCCLDVIRPDSDLDRMMLALQEQLGRVSETGRIRPGDISIK